MLFCNKLRDSLAKIAWVVPSLSGKGILLAGNPGFSTSTVPPDSSPSGWSPVYDPLDIL